MDLFDQLKAFRNALILENGQTYGSAMAEFQRVRFEAWDNCRRVYTETCTGSSKTTDCAAWLMSWVAHVEGWEAAVYAVDRDQAHLILKAAEGFVRRCEWLRNAPYGIEVQRGRIVSHISGSSCVVDSSDLASAEGILADCVILEQLESWPHEEMWETIFSRSHKRNCKLIVIANAPKSEQLWNWRVRDMALQNTMGNWIFLSATAKDLPWLSEQELEEKRLGMREAQFMRLYYNVVGSCEDSLFTKAQIAAMEVLEGPAEARGEEHRRVIQALDLGTRRDLTALAVIGERIDGTQDLLNMIVWQGHGASAEVSVSEVEKTIIDLHAQYGGECCVFDPDQMIGSAQRLRCVGVPMKEFRFTAKSVDSIANQLYRRGIDGKLRIYPDAGPGTRFGRHSNLQDEMASCKMVEGAIGMKIEQKGSGTKDRLIALGMGSLWLVQNMHRRIESISLSEYFDRLGK